MSTIELAKINAPVLPAQCLKECAPFQIVCSPYGETILLESKDREGLQADIDMIESNAGKFYQTSWGQQTVGTEYTVYAHSEIDCAYERI